MSLNGLLSKQIENSLKRVERKRERCTRCNRYSYHDRLLTVRPKTSFHIVIQESTLEQTINGQALPCLDNMEIYFYCQMTRHFYDIKNHKNQIPVEINFRFNLLPHFAYFLQKSCQYTLILKMRRLKHIDQGPCHTIIISDFSLI